MYCYNEAQRKKKEREKHEKQEEEANADEKKKSPEKERCLVKGMDLMSYVFLLFPYIAQN